MTFARGGGELTPFHSHVLEAALDLEARLVIVDTAADTFGGNENDRSQVRQFVSRALGSIAQKINGAVLLCAHPSRSGLSSGEGDGGSTGWSNAFRSRLYLRPLDHGNGEKPDPNARVLERRKANYASRNDEIRLRWRNGVIGPEPSKCAPGAAPYGKVEAGDIFLTPSPPIRGAGTTALDQSPIGQLCSSHVREVAGREALRIPRGRFPNSNGEALRRGQDRKCHLRSQRRRAAEDRPRRVRRDC